MNLFIYMCIYAALVNIQANNNRQAHVTRCGGRGPPNQILLRAPKRLGPTLGEQLYLMVLDICYI